MNQNPNRIIKKIKENKVGIFPCDTIFGLIGRVDEEVIKKITEIKNRLANQPFIILIPSPKFLDKFVDSISDSAQKYIHEYWPGPLTIIFKKHQSVSKIFTANKDTIAIRYPLFKPLNNLLDELNEPLISTSPNLSGEKTPILFEEISNNIKQKVDFIYNQDISSVKKESSIIDCSQEPPVIIRKGCIF